MVCRIISEAKSEPVKYVSKGKLETAK